MILRIIVDHGFCHDFVFRVSPGICQMCIHESRYLIHVQVNVGNIRRWDG